MSAASHDPLLHDLQLEVAAEIKLVVSTDSPNAWAQPASLWQFDPTDIEREEIGLRSLLGAVVALNEQPRDQVQGMG